MIADFKVVSTIPARGGSKAIKNKIQIPRKSCQFVGKDSLVIFPK